MFFEKDLSLIRTKRQPIRVLFLYPLRVLSSYPFRQSAPFRIRIRVLSLPRGSIVFKLYKHFMDIIFVFHSIYPSNVAVILIAMPYFQLWE